MWALKQAASKALLLQKAVLDAKKSLETLGIERLLQKLDVKYRFIKFLTQCSGDKTSQDDSNQFHIFYSEVDEIGDYQLRALVFWMSTVLLNDIAKPKILWKITHENLNCPNSPKPKFTQFLAIFEIS